ncbi:MAG: DUF481 domain-containing protein [Flavobacteriales bacterium]|nr:DUF481 domain-containing protein [Flavobacteriales bacterium]
MLKAFRPHGLPTLVALLCAATGQAQTDSLFLANGNILVGELKNMAKNVATMETPYSKSDFTIEWDQVRMARTTSLYLTETTGGERITMRLHSPDADRVLLINNGDTLTARLADIVFLRSVKGDFWGRASAALDLGYNFTKANNLQQFSLYSQLGYLTDKWSGNLVFNSVRSTQDNAEDIRRSDLTIGYRRLLPYRLFAGADISFLANTEQRLDLRSSIQPLFGRYFVRSNTWYFLFFAGAAATEEKFTSEAGDRSSFEGLFGLELNLFNIGDLGLFLSSKALPSFTESGRWRMDHRFNVTYDLPRDFYIRAGITVNYDNQPVEGGTETDYVLQTGFGWKL